MHHDAACSHGRERRHVHQASKPLAASGLRAPPGGANLGLDVTSARTYTVCPARSTNAWFERRAAHASACHIKAVRLGSPESGPGSSGNAQGSSNNRSGGALVRELGGQWGTQEDTVTVDTAMCYTCYTHRLARRRANGPTGYAAETRALARGGSDGRSQVADLSDRSPHAARPARGPEARPVDAGAAHTHGMHSSVAVRRVATGDRGTSLATVAPLKLMNISVEALIRRQPVPACEPTAVQPPTWRACESRTARQGHDPMPMVWSCTVGTACPHGGPGEGVTTAATRYTQGECGTRQCDVRTCERRTEPSSHRGTKVEGAGTRPITATGRGRPKQQHMVVPIGLVQESCNKTQLL